MKTSNLFLCFAALALSFGCEAEPEGSVRPFEAIDLTSDLFHRAQSGMFAPDREPVFLRTQHPIGPESKRHDFEFHSDFGSFWIRPDARGRAVVYMDPQMFFSHWAASNDLPFARTFTEWPKHPL